MATFARWVAGLVLVSLSARTAAGQGDSSWTLREVRVGTRDVFELKQAAEEPLYGLFNALHVTTHEAVVLRELWFGAGDTIGEDQRAELERNLRATGLFGAAEVRFAPTGVPGEADLIVDTRDRFSLIASATGSVVGGVGGYNATVGETNLFGSGNSLSLNLSGNDRDETETRFDYLDRHLFDTWHQLNVSVGDTQEGPFAFIGVTRPFKHLRDPYSWGLSAGYVDDDVDYFDGGESVAEVPNQTTSLRGFVEHGWGPPDLRRFVGLELRHSEADYGTPAGVPGFAGSPDLSRVPDELQQTTFGPLARIEWNRDFRKLRGIDSIDYVQDVTLGLRAELFAGALYRAEAGERDHTQTLVTASVGGAAEVARATYLTLELAGSRRMNAGEAPGHWTSAALHAFNQTLDQHTFALSVVHEAVAERENLPIQLNLGEDNGLRGYPAREFSGTHRTRLNLEDRYDTGLAWRSFHLGLVAFFDAGWINDDAPGDRFQSAGVGLRFGSSEVLGGGVIRIDLAFPLEDVPGEDYGPTISIALGQVFGFFGNSSTLATR